MSSFNSISGGPIAGRDLDYVAPLDAVVTTGQGGQSVVASATVSQASSVTSGQGGQSVVAAGGVSQSGAITVGQGSQSVASVATVAQAADVTTGQGGQSANAAGVTSLDGAVAAGQGSQSVAGAGGVAQSGAVATTGQGSQSIAASGAVSAAAVVTPAITGGSSRGLASGHARYPKLRIATTVLPEPLPAITARGVTGQGGQSVVAFGSAGANAVITTSQGSQLIAAQADSNNLRLLREEDEFWLIAA